MTRSFAILSAAMLSMAIAFPASGSGTVAMPEQQETLASHRSCIARLKQAQQEDRDSRVARKIREDGSVREVTLDLRTRGVEKIGRQHARYEARIWYHHGRPTEDGSQVETSHSWEHRALECRGKVLTINASNGFTLSTFDPAS